MAPSAIDWGAFKGARWDVFFVLVGVSALLAVSMAILAAGRRNPARQAAEEHSLESVRLCSFILKTAQLDPHAKPGYQLASAIQSIFEIEAVAVFDADLGEVYRAGEWFDDLEDLLRNIYFFGTISEDQETGLVRRPLLMGSLPIGAMLLRGEINPLTANAIAWLVAITFDRYHAFANESRTESARQTEQLRSTVLDSLAHAYKTPLTVIGAASSGLAAIGSLTPAQAGLAALIDEQTELLSHLTMRLLKTAQLDVADLTPHSETVAIAPLIDDVVASLRDQLSSISVKVAMPREDLSIQCDRGLLVALLTQYVDNAGKYADSGTMVTIEAAEQADRVVFSVHTIGPVIPTEEHERIFDRYYRSSMATNKAPGTGIGLAVAKRAAQAHGGHVWVTSDARRGTTFYASLPTAQKGTVGA